MIITIIMIIIIMAVTVIVVCVRIQTEHFNTKTNACVYETDAKTCGRQTAKHTTQSNKGM